MAYINQTYSNNVQPGASTVNHVSFSEGENKFISVESEEDIISVKLDVNGSAYLVYELEAYIGTYTTDSENDSKFYLQQKKAERTKASLLLISNKLN